MMSVTIDGSMGEGGGQILRTSLSLSALTQNPVRITNIRAGRPNPGLRAQHLTSLRAIGAINKGAFEGGELGSSEVSFHPGITEAGRYEFDIGTAGSVTLLIHTLLPPLLYCDKASEITVIGGTDVPWSPTTSYYRNVTLAFLKRMGIDAHLDVLEHGYYPKGGGSATISIKPWKKERPIGKIKVVAPDRALIESCAHGLGSGLAERQASAAKKELGMIDAEVLIEENGRGQGNALTISAWAGDVPIGCSSIGRKGYSPEDLGRDAAREFIKIVSRERCDQHLPDQIVPLMFLKGEEAVLPIPGITGHLSTNLDVTKRFMDIEYEITEEKMKIKGIRR